MLYKYVITPLCGLFIAGRWITEIPRDADGKRRINLTQAVAQSSVDRGWIVLDDDAPPILDETPESREYDFKGYVIKNARRQVNTFTGAQTLSADDKGALILVDSASQVAITLPNSWEVGEGCTIRQAGAGIVNWALQTGATVSLPASKSAHVQIAEQNAEIDVVVIANSDDAHAKWSIVGSTSNAPG